MALKTARNRHIFKIYRNHRFRVVKVVMGKLCLIYNFAPSYREAIFKLIDEEFDCDWFFGNNNTDIKGLDLSLLKNVKLLKNTVVLKPPLYFQKGVLSLLYKKEYTTYFMLGDLFCISTWLFIILAKLFYPHKRIYFWSHGWYGREKRVKRWLKKNFFGWASGTFLYGNYARDLMLKEGFSSDKLFVIHNSLLYKKQLALRKNLNDSDIYRQHFGNENRNLIFIGRLTPVKRLDLLIEALFILKKRKCHYNLILVGDGVQKEQLQNEVRKKGLEKCVWFYGACYEESRNAELIYNADLCVAPGNVGLTAIHTMVFGTPVATHNSFEYQMPEFEAIHEGITGTYFIRGDTYSIADSIERWFKFPRYNRQSIREACYKEIDMSWTPQYQLEIIKKHIEI